MFTTRRLALLAGWLMAVSCVSGTTIVKGKYGLQLDSNNAETSASSRGAEDLDVTLRASFASRLENVDFFPRLNAKDEYDAIIFVRVNFQQVAGDPNPHHRVGLAYEIANAQGTFATGFVPINLADWPPEHVSSDRVYAALSAASEELASRVAQTLMKKHVPGATESPARGGWKRAVIDRPYI